MDFKPFADAPDPYGIWESISPYIAGAAAGAAGLSAPAAAGLAWLRNMYKVFDYTRHDPFNNPIYPRIGTGEETSTSTGTSTDTRTPTRTRTRTRNKRKPGKYKIRESLDGPTHTWKKKFKTAKFVSFGKKKGKRYIKW